MSNIFEDIYDWIFGNDKKKKKKRKKKERKRAEAEKQRQIELERQKKKIMWKSIISTVISSLIAVIDFIISALISAIIAAIAYVKRKRQKRTELKAERQKIYAIANLFTNKSLHELTCSRIIKATNLEELHIIYEEAKYTQNIESNANILPKSPYYEAIIQRLFKAYSTHNNRELQTLMGETKQLQELIQPIKSYPLSETLQRFTDERIANSGMIIGKLHKIQREALCASNIEQECIKLDKQGCVTYPIREKLEDAYRNHNIQVLFKLMAEVKQLSEIYELIHSIKTYSLKLSENLQKITDEKLNKAGHNIDELRRIEQEVCDICGIERSFSGNEQYAKDISKTLENAYRNRDSNELESLRQMIRNIEISRSRWRVNPFT